MISASKAAEHAYEMMDRIEPQFSMQTEFYDKEISKIKHQEGQKHNEKLQEITEKALSFEDQTNEHIKMLTNF